MIDLVYTLESVDDLQRLRDFIAEQNPASAKRIAGELLRRITMLLQVPLMGETVSSAPDPEVIRDMLIGNYTVRYAIHG